MWLCPLITLAPWPKQQKPAPSSKLGPEHDLPPQGAPSSHMSASGHVGGCLITVYSTKEHQRVCHGPSPSPRDLWQECDSDSPAAAPGQGGDAGQPSVITDLCAHGHTAGCSQETSRVDLATACLPRQDPLGRNCRTRGQKLCAICCSAPAPPQGRVCTQKLDKYWSQ